MRNRNLLSYSCLALAAALATACSAQPPSKTELLPADGGDLGKAFTELQGALAAADKVRADKLLDPKWHVDGDEQSYSALLKGLKPTGGKRQGDRATLFVLGDHYAAFNATHAPNGWYFDLPTPIFFGEGEKSDCSASPQRFPCGATSAPDSQVSGSASEQHFSVPDKKNEILKVPLFDGFAVHEVSVGKRAPLWTRLILTGTAVDPQVLARSNSPSGLASGLMYVLTLDIAPDGKSAHGRYNGDSGTRRFDVKDGAGLSLDTNQPKRLRGRVMADIKDAGKLDVTFDVGIASEYEESNMAL